MKSFVLHCVTQWPNLQQGELKACSRQPVLRISHKVCNDDRGQMLEGSEFQTEGLSSSFFLAGRVFSPALRPYMIGPMRSPDIQNQERKIS